MADANHLRAGSVKQLCYFCGNARPPRKNCPAKDAACNFCQKVGHYFKVCQKRLGNRSIDAIKKTAAIQGPKLATFSASEISNNTWVLCNVKINGIVAKSLLDTGSSDCCTDRRFADKHSLNIRRAVGEVTLAETSVRMPIRDQCITHLLVENNEYSDVTLNVLDNITTDVMIGKKIFKEHDSVTFTFEGHRPPLTLNALKKMSVPFPKPFSHLSENCRPVADKPRKYSQADLHFIRDETQRLLSDDLIEPSNSPWRAQVLVATEQSGKRRMVIDYSRTISRFTQLDAYPLPRIDEIVELAQYRVFTTVDLKSTYHQLELNPRDRDFTAFQSGKALYQWRSLPFGLTNAVSEFQRTIDYIVRENDLKGCSPYLDDITIAGANQVEHDRNLQAFYVAASKGNLTINESKTQLSRAEISLLGYMVGYRSVEPQIPAGYNLY